MSVPSTAKLAKRDGKVAKKAHEQNQDIPAESAAVAGDGESCSDVELS